MDQLQVDTNFTLDHPQHASSTFYFIKQQLKTDIKLLTMLINIKPFHHILQPYILKFVQIVLFMIKNSTDIYENRQILKIKSKQYQIDLIQYNYIDDLYQYIHQIFKQIINMEQATNNMIGLYKTYIIQIYHHYIHFLPFNKIKLINLSILGFIMRGGEESLAESSIDLELLNLLLKSIINKFENLKFNEKNEQIEISLQNELNQFLQHIMNLFHQMSKIFKNIFFIATTDEILSNFFLINYQILATYSSIKAKSKCCLLLLDLIIKWKELASPPLATVQSPLQSPSATLINSYLTRQFITQLYPIILQYLSKISTIDTLCNNLVLLLVEIYYFNMEISTEIHHLLIKLSIVSSYDILQHQLIDKLKKVTSKKQYKKIFIQFLSTYVIGKQAIHIYDENKKILDIAKFKPAPKVQQQSNGAANKIQKEDYSGDISLIGL